MSVRFDGVVFVEGASVSLYISSKMPRRKIQAPDPLAAFRQTEFSGLRYSPCFGKLQFGNALVETPWVYEIGGKLASRHGFSANARTCALNFVNDIEPYRKKWQEFLKAFTETRDPAGWPIRVQQQGGQRFLPNDAWLRRAFHLPQFSAQCWQQWAELAWEVVVASSPNRKPELNPTLCQGIYRICNVRKERRDSNPNKTRGSSDYVVRKSRSIAVADLKSAFVTGFEEIATARSRRTGERHLTRHRNEK